MAYGGPNTLEDVEPYLLDVRGYRPTSPEIIHEVRERYREIGGRSPILEQTQAQADAIEQTVVIADRYQRAFLRLLKAFRDNRRLFGMLVVTGGQVNVGERQLNVATADVDDS